MLIYSDCILDTCGIAWVWREGEIQSDRECIFNSYPHNLYMMYIYIYIQGTLITYVKYIVIYVIIYSAVYT